MDDPRRRVLARVETEPIPAGLWDSLSDALMETAAGFGVMCGGHVVDCAEDGWEPAPSVEPESWRPTGEIERLRAALAETEGDLLRLVRSMTVPWERIPEARREKIRQRCRQLEAEIAAGDRPEPIGMEDLTVWLWKLLAAVFPNAPAKPISAETIATAVEHLAVLHDLAREADRPSTFKEDGQTLNADGGRSTFDRQG